MQQGDVLLYQTNDDGEINVDNGIVEMSGGLQTTAYLSLFGGNENDSTSADDPLTWWGNLSENEISNQYRSETQFLLQSIPATPANLRRIEDAAKRDLAWMITDKVASEVTAAASIPALNRIKLSVTIEAVGEESTFEYVENWRSKS